MNPSIFDEPSTPASFNARAAIVNRTHRVIRERAVAMQKRKRTTRDLIVPFAICSTVLLLIASAVWSLGDENLAELEGGLGRRIMELGADAGSNISILLVWFLPLTVITAAIIFLQRSRKRSGEASR